MTGQDMNDNVSLLVSNQSFDVNPVDIKVSIDGQVILQDKFDVQGDQLPQHNWQQYNLRLEEGSHDLVAESKKGQAQLQTTIKVKGQHSITVAFWYNPIKDKSGGYFTIESGSHPMSVM